jgi:transposase-like protein
MGRNRTYSDEERVACLAALAANGGDIGLTARQTGVPKKTLENWAKGRVKSAAKADANLGPEKRKDLAEKLEDLAHTLADAAPGKVEKAGLQPTLISLGVAVDKARLLRGKATAIGEHRHLIDLSKLSDEELAALERVFDRGAVYPSADQD